VLEREPTSSTSPSRSLARKATGEPRPILRSGDDASSSTHCTMSRTLAISRVGLMSVHGSRQSSAGRSRVSGPSGVTIVWREKPIVLRPLHALAHSSARMQISSSAHSSVLSTATSSASTRCSQLARNFAVFVTFASCRKLVHRRRSCCALCSSAWPHSRRRVARRRRLGRLHLHPHTRRRR
jgi:hypothetical protein